MNKAILKDVETGEIKKLNEAEIDQISLSGKKYLIEKSFSATMTFSRKVTNKVVNMFRCIFDVN